MEDACRFIINEIIEGRVKSKTDLEKAKLKACRDFKLIEFMSNSLLLENATPSERAKISPLYTEKTYKNYFRCCSGCCNVQTT